jgi:glutathione-regulated potassium-efflux system protein KefB
MQPTGFLDYALVFLIGTVLLVPLFLRLKLGAVLGYLAAGVAIGPDALGIVTQSESILHFAELGIVFLLFVLGLELSPRRLWQMRRSVFGLGGLQLGLSALALGALAYAWLGQPKPAIVIGLALAMSSTAIGMQMLAERKELASEHGRHGFGVLLFQDIAAIPILALIPLMGLASAAAQPISWFGFAKAIAVVIVAIVVGRVALPPLFRAISRLGGVEMFSAAALLVVIGTAWLMHQAGLTLTLGAFIAGVLLANTEFRHEIESHIEPFKGLLLGLFFIAVGMSLDLDLLQRYPWLVLGGALAVFALKFTVLAFIGWRPGRLGARETVLFGALLGQAGEFAFVILTEGNKAGLFAPETHGVLLAIVSVSMALTPLLVLAAEQLGRRFDARSPERPFDTLPGDEARVIIAGFGRVGQIVSRVLTAQKVPHTVLEASAEQVDFSRRFGSTIFYGDPSRPELLRAARADRAEVFVLAHDDPEASVRTARVVRRLYPHLKLLARARNRQHVFKLMDLGVDFLVRETFHSSLRLSAEALKALGVPDPVAEERVERFREHDERLMADQYLVHDDESALIQSTQEARAELATLFEADRRTE